MIDDVMIKSHLIITSVQEQYEIKWCGKLKDTNPLLVNDKPVFVVIGGDRRVELNTLNMKQIEECGKRLTTPKGRAAITTDKSFIYIKEIDGKETCIGVVIHHHVKKYAPMFDAVGWE